MYHRSLDLSHPLAWTVPALLTDEECAALIERVEAAGPQPATVAMLRGPVMRPEIRNNHRAILEDPALAAALDARVRGYVPERLSEMTLVGVGDRFRFYRYDPGQRFAPHYDGAFVRSPDEYSLLTFMVYLNEGFEGGETDFPTLGERVVPCTGTALFFQHRVLHEGCVVTQGRKYALRSDILYRRT